jgi:hypothetical protein
VLFPVAAWSSDNASHAVHDVYTSMGTLTRRRHIWSWNELIVAATIAELPMSLVRSGRALQAVHRAAATN